MFPSIKNFEDIKYRLYPPSPTPTNPTPTPKIHPKKPYINFKKMKIEKRGRKPTIKEVDKIRSLYNKKVTEELLLFEIKSDELPESPPFWFL